jgi:hypothetical protein
MKRFDVEGIAESESGATEIIYHSEGEYVFAADALKEIDTLRHVSTVQTEGMQTMAFEAGQVLGEAWKESDALRAEIAEYENAVFPVTAAYREILDNSNRVATELAALKLDYAKLNDAFQRRRT